MPRRLDAGASIPKRNIERLLRDTQVVVPPDDQRRLDLIVPNLNVALGLPFFCDITIVSPISRNGIARSGTSNVGGKLLERAERENNSTYAPVVTSGLGALYCLGHEVYGRWHTQGIDLLIALAREHARGLLFRIKQ